MGSVNMKVWTKMRIKDQNKDINIIAKSLANYLYKEGPIVNIYNKYNVKELERLQIEKYTTDRIAGLLLLYFSRNTKRINDIVNKYNKNNNLEVFPELEGYIER